jgi:hypothetical protein
VWVKGARRPPGLRQAIQGTRSTPPRDCPRPPTVASKRGGLVTLGGRQPALASEIILDLPPNCLRNRGELEAFASYRCQRRLPGVHGRSNVSTSLVPSLKRMLIRAARSPLGQRAAA